MTPDTILELIAIGIAILALLPKSRRLSLRMRLNVITLFFISFSFIIVIFFLFYNPFSSLLGFPEWPISKVFLTPKEAAFFVLISSVPIILIVFKIQKLNRRKADLFKNFVENLIHERDFLTLFDFVESHTDQLIKISKKDFLLSKIKQSLSRYSEESGDSFLNLIAARKNKTNSYLSNLFASLKIKVRIFAGHLSKLLPNFEKSSSQAREVFRQIFTSTHIVDHMTLSRPYLALTFFEKKVPFEKDLLDNYFHSLLNNESSIIYYEVEKCLDVKYDWLYRIPNRLRIIRFFFKDASIAHNYGLWSPIGNELLNKLEKLGRNPNKDPYNFPIEDFDSSGKWRSQLFIGIRLLEIMVSRALYQNVDWHMWLYYYVHLTKKIVDNYQPHPRVDFEVLGWPTKYSFLVNEMLSNLSKWIIAVDDLPESQENITLDSIDCGYENSNIPKSSILALVMCSRYCLINSPFSTRTRQKYANIIFNTYFELLKSDRLKDYSTVLLDCLTQDSPYEGNLGYVLLNHFENYDWIPYAGDDIDHFKEQLESSM